MRRYMMMTAAAAAVATLAALSPAAAGTASQAPRAGSGTSAHAQQAASGSRLWARRYNGPGNGEDSASSVAVSRDGTRVFVTGSSEGRRTGTSDYATVAYSAVTGKTLWVSRYGLRNGWYGASSLAVSRSRVFVTGSGENPTTGAAAFATAAYSAATGRRLWVSCGGAGSSVAVNHRGTRVFVTGGSRTLAYSAATGRRLWVSRGGPGSSVAVNAAGARVFVTGSGGTVAYSAATGRRLWVKRAGPFSSVAVNRRGTVVFLTGSGEDPATGAAAFVTVADSAATGRRLWVSYYNRPGDEQDRAFSVVVNPGGTAVFVTGIRGQWEEHADYATVAYSAATGRRLWVSRYAGAAWDQDSGFFPSSLAVSPDGTRVYFMGNGGGYATIAYSAANGTKMWARHYNPPGTGAVASSIAVSPRGTAVFVTGTSMWHTAVTDYATVAYRG
jgi:hypothetical protein